MKKLYIICLFVFLFFVPRPVWAGGFFYTQADGNPYSWENPTQIPIHPETGACGDYSNSDMITMIQEVLANWTDIADVELGFAIEENQIGAIAASEFDDAFYGTTNGNDNIYTPYNAIIFDDDGAIHTEKHSCEELGQYLGTTTITNLDEDAGLITRAAFVMNCACFRDTHTVFCDGGFDPCENNAIAYTDNVMRAIFQHEMGHFLNLNHTPLYENLFDDTDTANDDFVPLMYPFLNNPDRDISPKQDDIIALATMYPSASFDDSYCTFTGTLLDQSTEANELQCATISAINTDKSESVSFITGATAPGESLNSDNDRVDYNSTEQAFESTSDRGRFTLKLKPDESYQITVAAINSQFVGSAQVLPCRNDQHAECTDAILAACNDGDESTECEPCVADDVLITNAEYNSLYRDQCLPGATIDVGALTSPDNDSISLETALTLNGDVTSGDDDDDTTTSSGGCQLTQNSNTDQPQLPFFAASLAILVLALFKLERFCS